MSDAELSKRIIQLADEIHAEHLWFEQARRLWAKNIGKSKKITEDGTSLTASIREHGIKRQHRVAELRAMAANAHAPAASRLLKAATRLDRGEDIAEELREVAATFSASLAAAPQDVDNAAIPKEFRTPPMSMAEAGTLLGLGSNNKNTEKQRDAAGMAVKRMMERGGLNYEKMGTKFVFDKRKFPALQDENGLVPNYEDAAARSEALKPAKVAKKQKGTK